MAVQLEPVPPSQLALELRADKSLIVTWKYPKLDGHVFHLKVEYFDPAHPLEAEETVSKTCHGLGAHLEARRKPATWSGCTLKVWLTADIAGVRSPSVTAQVSWDDELPPEEAKTDLSNRMKRLSKDLHSFRQKRGSSVQVVVLGPQHHGKSSFINHVYRCLIKDLQENDQMESAPTGNCEKTLEVKALDMQQGLSLIDTPAIPNMSREMTLAVETLLASGVSEGVRRSQLARRQSWIESQFFLQKPPHAAVLVISLCHWRDQQDEMRDYLTAMAKCFKNASQGMVVFPFVVAATHRDEFLKDCKAERPHEELQKAVSQIRRAANTNYVFAVTSHGRQSRPSASVNEETFQLISQLVSLAGHQDTGRVIEQRGKNWRQVHACCMSPLMAILMIVFAILLACVHVSLFRKYAFLA